MPNFITTFINVITADLGMKVLPLLFIIDINDLFNVVQHSSVLMFADDCKLIK